LVFDLREFSGSLYVRISAGGNVIAVGTVRGGYRYGLPMRIVPPIHQGQTYTFVVSVYEANTGRHLGTASASYVEKYCPSVEISNVAWTSFVYGRRANVTVTLRNLGQSDWTYTVSAWTQGGSAGRVSASLKVPAGRSATTTLSLPVTSFSSTSDILVVEASCAGGQWHVTAQYPVQIIPPRPGPFRFAVATVQARLGQPTTFTIGAENLGYDANLVSLSIPGVQYSVNLPSTAPAGSTVPIQVTFTPAMAGVYNLTVTLTYKSPLTGATYQDTVSVPVVVYAELTVSAEDHMGNPVPINATINGQRGSTLWVLPGTHTVSVPSVVQLSPDSKLVFSGWSNGQNTPTISVNVQSNTVVRAVYIRMYRIALNLGPALPSGVEWAAGGSTYSKEIPQYVGIGDGARWALQALYVNGQPVSSLSFVVTGPVVVNASWVKQFRVVVDCGQAACINGGSRMERWVNAGGNFSVALPQYVPIDLTARWRLADQPTVQLVVDKPVTITPNYVKQYLVELGYVINTATGAGSPVVVQSLWADAGTTMSVDVNSLRPPEAPGVSYRLAGIKMNGQPASQTFAVTGPASAFAVWDMYYYLDVSTPIGTATGSGWYLAGSTAVVKVEQTSHGFLVRDVFEGWVDDQGRVYRNATLAILVSRPMALRAVWGKDYSNAFWLTGGLAASGVVAWKRKEVTMAISTLTRRIGTTITRRTASRKIELEPVKEEETRVWAQEEKKEEK
jgi:predicted secreted protein